jgi:hypothetical protein
MDPKFSLTTINTRRFSSQSHNVGPVERHRNLTAVRSIARDFKKYKPVALLYDLFHAVNRPVKPFYTYLIGRKLASQAAGHNKSGLYIGCQTCTVESLLAEAICLPSGDHATLLMAALVPDVLWPG